jgi:hypothetical protein
MVAASLSSPRSNPSAHAAIDQSLWTVIVAVHPERADGLRELLGRLAQTLPPFAPLAPESPLPFGELADVHFARWLMLEETRDLSGRRIGPQLVLAIIHDGPRAAFVPAFVRAAEKTLREIYAHCEDLSSDRTLAEYLLAHSNEAAAFFVSARWRPAALVRGEAELRRALEARLDAAPATAVPSAIHRELRDALADTPLRWALSPAARPGLAHAVAHWGALAALALAGIALAPLALPALLALLVCVRRAERREQRTTTLERGPSVGEAPAAIARLESLMTYSGYSAQDQLSLVSFVKPGPVRWLSLRAVLLYLRFRTAYLDVFGRLDGLPSVHFAQWNLIDGGRRLLFLSNYDGTWEAYLGDFVDFAFHGLNAIWSNVIGFPPTRWLAFGGASSAQRMTAFVGSQQVPCALWWSAYPSLSVLNVENDIAIRDGLAQPALSDPAAWLRRL